MRTIACGFEKSLFYSIICSCSIPAKQVAPLKTQENSRCGSFPIVSESNPLTNESERSA